jgi:uncharacterized Zn-finger protein
MTGQIIPNDYVKKVGCRYECKRCNKVFTKKSNYEFHINRKIPCKQIVSVVKIDNEIFEGPELNADNISDLPNEYVCPHCDKAFTRKDNLMTHIDKYCKIKKVDDISKADTFQKLSLKINILERKNKEIKKENDQLKKELNLYKQIKCLQEKLVEIKTLE